MADDTPKTVDSGTGWKKTGKKSVNEWIFNETPAH